jgi:hypothetical protein
MEGYLVFARTEYDEPVEFKGRIEAEGDEAAREVALEKFGKDWLELVLAPEREIYWVQRKEEEVEV